ncbi:MAG: 2-oxoglutarate dehydrogenase, E2 component, dihydrolipoamide succinyltransferase [Mycobacteriales bacterium]
MPVSVTMPRLGESVSEGTVTRWLKSEGETVAVDEPLLEVSTDKVDTEIPSPSAGVLKSIKVNEDETVEVGAELAVIDDAAAADGAATDEQPAPAAQEPQPEPAGAAEPEPAEEPAAEATEAGTAAVVTEEPQTPEPEQPKAAEAQASRADQSPDASSQPETADGSADGGGAAYVTPLVRKLAAEHDVDLASLSGTGVGGRIRKQDVLDAAKNRGAASEPQEIPNAPSTSASAPKAPTMLSQPQLAAKDTTVKGRTEKLSRLRTVIAKRMVESLQVSAQLTTVVEADITKIARLRQHAKATFESREGVKLSFLPFFAVATCEALKAHPTVNASMDVEAGTVTYHEAEHLGIAVDTDRGLLVPVIHDAGDLNLGGMARKIVDLAERTRNNSVGPDELGGGTFTLTNTGSRGALFDTPIINQPQVGILGTGAVVKRPAVVDDPELGEVIAIRSTVYLALTYDHRMVDGADAARFLTSVKQRLEEGAFEADLGL